MLGRGQAVEVGLGGQGGRQNHLLYSRRKGEKGKNRPIIREVVPSSWSIVERHEEKREESQGGALCAIVAHWKFWELGTYGGQNFEEQSSEGGTDWSAKSFIIKRWLKTV